MYTTDEIEILNQYFTNVDLPVFCLKNLPEVVKGALFARYSRTHKSLRRLFLDEFYNESFKTSIQQHLDVTAASDLYNKVFLGFGDDSVAQLGGAHLACEGISNHLTKVLERSRLMAFLEQSTRYIRYDKKINGKYLYHIPKELDKYQPLKNKYIDTMDALFKEYSASIPKLKEHYAPQFDLNDPAQKRALNSKALDDARGLLPIATVSNVGIYGSGQSYEYLLIKLFACKDIESQELAYLMLQELNKVIPNFVKRVPIKNRGITWTNYLKDVQDYKLDCVALNNEETSYIQLVDISPQPIQSLVAAILYEKTEASMFTCKLQASKINLDEKNAIIKRYFGTRTDRRHKPGRALEHVDMTFDILADYGSFRDLQRHRMLTIEWQKPTISRINTHAVSNALYDCGMTIRTSDTIKATHALSMALIEHNLGHISHYPLPMCTLIRYCIKMNLREAVHMLELRTQPQGHPIYREICQLMYKEICMAIPVLGEPGVMMVNTDEITGGRVAQESKYQ